jgi:glycosyltransferase involved in cell wall biosynthesis
VERLSKRYPTLFLTLTEVEDWFELFAGLEGRYKFLETRKGTVSIQELYAYLHASDALVIPKDTSAAVVVSSTAYLCLGSGCPILAYDTNFFETLGNEVIKYRSLEELTQRIEDVFEGRENVTRTLETAEKYVQENSGWNIGKTFITLFESLRAEHIKVEMLVDESEVVAVSPVSVDVLQGLT